LVASEFFISSVACLQEKEKSEFFGQAVQIFAISETISKE
jgi:hypothetical protein